MEEPKRIQIEIIKRSPVTLGGAIAILFGIVILSFVVVGAVLYFCINYG
ncbi:MAG: hypothetical protein J6L75_04330 [Alistipes sp.]|nr:hypothetical protein [Alistipes sp.]